MVEYELWLQGGLIFNSEILEKDYVLSTYRCRVLGWLILDILVLTILANNLILMFAGLLEYTHLPEVGKKEIRFPEVARIDAFYGCKFFW